VNLKFKPTKMKKLEVKRETEIKLERKWKK